MSEADKPGVVHPMVVAFSSLAEDMLSIFAFLILFAVFHNVLVATSVAILVGAGQVLRAKLQLGTQCLTIRTAARRRARVDLAAGPPPA